MNTFGFEYPWALLLLPPLLYCLYRCKERVSPRYFVHLHLLAPEKPWLKVEWLLKVLTLLALVIALASPIRFDKEDPMNRQGIDIVLCIDASGSMNASGFEKASHRSRFEIVQDIASSFVMRRTEDNVGVVLFGDFAFIASPVTYEKAIITEMIGYLSEGMAGQNTAIGEGLAMSVRALERSKASSRVIILLTDGEHNSGRVSPKEAVKLAKERSIKIYTIGIGKEEEFDASLLQMIADESGAAMFTAEDSERLADVYGRIDKLERSSIKSKAYLKKEYLFSYALLVAFLILFYFFRRRR